MKNCSKYGPNPIFVTIRQNFIREKSSPKFGLLLKLAKIRPIWSPYSGLDEKRVLKACLHKQCFLAV
jgi:hypothetical protein